MAFWKFVVPDHLGLSPLRSGDNRRPDPLGAPSRHGLTRLRYLMSLTRPRLDRRPGPTWRHTSQRSCVSIRTLRPSDPALGPHPLRAGIMPSRRVYRRLDAWPPSTPEDPDSTSTAGTAPAASFKSRYRKGLGIVIEYLSSNARRVTSDIDAGSAILLASCRPREPRYPPIRPLSLTA
jgi:hypothetical protein